MATDHRARIARIRRFDQLVAYLRDDMGWPIESADFEDLTFDYTPEELGIDAKNAAKIQEIKRLRPLAPGQPWGIFFVKFEPKRLPVVALRRILSQVALKKRASANKAEQQAWAADDLLFISNYGEDGERRIAFAHFAKPTEKSDLPTLKVLGWDNLDTPLHLDDVADKLVHHLSWPEDTSDEKRWRARWRGAFVLRHGEVVSTSKELSVRLAELARAIRDRIKTAISIETEKGPLTKLMKAFQTTLVHDLTGEGFADMYAQTIAYGLLSSRIADPQKKTADDFAAHMRTNPFLRELMETFLKVGGRKGKKGGPGIDFDELGVSEVIELLDNANMEAVIRDFGDRNPQEDPVIHFYELFLKEYDAKKRMQRGVFYTPRPVVSYIVRSVDELLRTEFRLEDGLADTTTWGEMVKLHKDLKIPDGVSPDQEFVQILDPATGTGTFLVEVIDVIHKTLITKWKRANYGPNEIERLWNDYVSNHLLTRLHGYELMMAPYAIAHLKVGLKLHETEYRFQSEERARIYLTNALEPAQDFSGQFEFAVPALAAEANAVNEVKRRGIFTVLLGNPPYSGESANSSAWVYDLLRGKVGQKTGDFNSYFHVANRPLGEHNSKWLNDDYVKFVRFVHWTTERAGVGAVCMITNHGYLDNPTFRGMRYSLGGTFQKVFVLDLHGNSKKKEKTPTGGKDDNVFEIQQGVAIGVFLRAPWFSRPGDFRHAELWGGRDSKYKLLEAGSALRMEWTAFEPSSPHYLFTPQSTELRGEYDAWWQVSDIFPINSTGIATARDDLTVHWSETEVWEVVRDFAHMNSEEARLKYDLGPDARDWQVKLAQADLIDSGLTKKKVLPVMYKPFDFRYTYFTGKSRGFHCMPRGEVMNHVISDPGNRCLVFSRSVSVSQSFHHVFCTNRLMLVRAFTDAACVAYVAPLFTQSVPEDLGLLFEAETSSNRWNGKNVNFADQFLADLGARLGLNSIRRWMSEISPNDIFDYIYAILHSPRYSQRYEKFLKVEFPRIPLTSNMLLFKSLTEIGGKLSSLHLLESVELEASMVEYWGGSSAIVEKVLWNGNSVWLDKAQTTGFKGVSEDVWNFHIGGYQVCQKWLKDRKGRALSKSDVVQYRKIVVAISETMRLMKKIDEVIEQHGGWPGAFQTKDAVPKQAKVIPFRPRPVQPTPKERYRTCVPLMPLKAAAGAFSAPQHIEDDSFEWVKVDTNHRLREGMFVSQVVGRSMEPLIPDGSYCLFRAPVEGTRQGKTVLVQLRDIADPETSQRFTVKRYKSDKANDGDSWRHERITLEPLNPDFKPIVMTDAEEGTVQVVAELVEVLSGESD